MASEEKSLPFAGSGTSDDVYSYYGDFKSCSNLPSVTLMEKSLPADWYRSPDIYVQEREKIFGKEWLFVVSSSQIQEPGQFATLDVMGFNVVVIRQADRSLKAFVNSCRHRASLLVTDSVGSCKSGCLTCPYHAWTYNLDGKLRKAPGFCDGNGSLPGFKPESHGLIEVPLKEISGLVFVKVHPRTVQLKEIDNTVNTKIDDFLSLESILKSYPFENYTYHSTKEFIVNCNWKVWIENYQECYHCRGLHPLFNRCYALDQYQIRNFPWGSHHLCPLKITDIASSQQQNNNRENNNQQQNNNQQPNNPLSGKDGDRKDISVSSNPLSGKDGEWLYIWPNLCLALYDQYYDTLQIKPLTPEKTLLVVNFYGKRSNDPEMMKTVISEASFTTPNETVKERKPQEKDDEGYLQMMASVISEASFTISDETREEIKSKNQATNKEYLKVMDEIISEASFTTFYEDIAASEKVQKGLNSGQINLQGGPLHPEKEAGVIFFDHLIRKSLSSSKESESKLRQLDRGSLEW